MVAILMDSVAVADTVHATVAAKWLQNRATVEPQQSCATAIYRNRPQSLI